VIESLVRRSGVGPGDLVIDFGAGPGTLTAPLAAAGSRVMAVERDDAFVATPRRRFLDRPAVRVVHADLRRVPLPRKAFAVVSSSPFAVSTPLLRRLLTPVPGRLALADLVVEWGLARRLTARRPRDLEVAWWASRYCLRVERRIPARCFAAAPRVDAAHLSVRRRSGVDGRTSALLWTVLTGAYDRPAAPAWAAVGPVATRGVARRVLRDLGVGAGVPAAAVEIADWVRVATELSGEKGVAAPRLPRRLLA
jgi:23S rRNA (adenine-N6)-dimethyltransferase